MTLMEMSEMYTQNADALRRRIILLREEARAQTSEDAARCLQRRIGELQPLLREARELATMTAHYYDRGYYRYEKYRL